MPLALEHGLDLVAHFTPFQKGESSKRKMKTLQWRDLADIPKCSRLTSPDV